MPIGVHGVYMAMPLYIEEQSSLAAIRRIRQCLATSTVIEVMSQCQARSIGTSGLSAFYSLEVLSRPALQVFRGCRFAEQIALKVMAAQL